MNDGLFKSWYEIEEEEKELTSAYEGGIQECGDFTWRVV